MAKIKADARNYRKHDDRNKALIKKSLEECGAGRSVLLDADNTLIAGNGVFEKAQELKIPVKIIETDGNELIAVKRTDLKKDDPKRKRLAVMDNSTSDSSQFDGALLMEDFSVEELSEMGIEEIDLQAVEEHTKEIVEDEYPDKAEPRCKVGQIWTLGNHRLMCGDSTDPAAVDALTAGQKVKLFYTDPPYNVNYEGANGLKIKNDDMDSRLFLEFLTKAFKNADGVMEAGAAFYIWHADTAVEFRNACLEVGWPLRQCLIWHKNHFIIGRQDYQWKHEPCLYGWKGGATHYFTEDRTNPTVIAAMRPEFAKLKKDELVSLLERLSGPETPGTVIDCEKPTKNEEHPTMKPIKLIAPMIENSSKPNWLVLDLFGGSGSTLIACEQLERKCLMMELDPGYCDVIIQRWENLTGQKAVLEA